MTDDVEMLWRMCQENYVHGRHHETQRSAACNFILLLEGGILAFIGNSFKNGASIKWPLPVFLIILGVFGALFSLKHYELYRKHLSIAAAYRDEIERRMALPLGGIRSAGEKPHRERWYFGVVGHVRLYMFWIALQLIVSVVGVLVLAGS